ncbi:MAG: hypothetical protein LBP21_03235 [Synergistaceae bacterium]|nr:hypothetical protein [Synergistaceae bacterium]
MLRVVTFGGLPIGRQQSIELPFIELQFIVNTGLFVRRFFKRRGGKSSVFAYFRRRAPPVQGRRRDLWG